MKKAAILSCVVAVQEAKVDAAKALADSLRRQRVEVQVEKALVQRQYEQKLAEHRMLQAELADAANEVLLCVQDANGDFRKLCGADGRLDVVATSVMRAEAVLQGIPAAVADAGACAVCGR